MRAIFPTVVMAFVLCQAAAGQSDDALSRSPNGGGRQPPSPSAAPDEQRTPAGVVREPGVAPDADASRVPVLPTGRLPGAAAIPPALLRGTPGDAGRGPDLDLSDPALHRGDFDGFPGEPGAGGLGNPGLVPPSGGGPGQEPVPEPATWILFMTGLGALSFLLWKRRAAAPSTSA